MNLDIKSHDKFDELRYDNIRNSGFTSLSFKNSETISYIQQAELDPETAWYSNVHVVFWFLQTNKLQFSNRIPLEKVIICQMVKNHSISSGLIMLLPQALSALLIRIQI